jgi:class 3 adenylate cyclase/CheY-like chemotaxis protein
MKNTILLTLLILFLGAFTTILIIDPQIQRVNLTRGSLDSPPADNQVYLLSGELQFARSANEWQWFSFPEDSFGFSFPVHNGIMKFGLNLEPERAYTLRMPPWFSAYSLKLDGEEKLRFGYPSSSRAGEFVELRQGQITFTAKGYTDIEMQTSFQNAPFPGPFLGKIYLAEAEVLQNWQTYHLLRWMGALALVAAMIVFYMYLSSQKQWIRSLHRYSYSLLTLLFGSVVYLDPGSFFALFNLPAFVPAVLALFFLQLNASAFYSYLRGRNKEKTNRYILSYLIAVPFLVALLALVLSTRYFRIIILAGSFLSLANAAYVFVDWYSRTQSSPRMKAMSAAWFSVMQLALFNTYLQAADWYSIPINSMVIVLVLAISGMFLLTREIFHAFEEQPETQMQQSLISGNWEEFINSLSHELRTPMNGIIGLTDAMLSDKQSTMDEDSTTSLKLINLSAIRLTNAVNNLLDIQTLQSDYFEPKMQALDMGIILGTAVSVSKVLLEGELIDIDNRVSPGAAPVYGDEKRLEQMFYNLIAGVGRFMRNGKLVIESKAYESVVDIVMYNEALEESEYIVQLYKVVSGSDNSLFSGGGLIDLGLKIIMRIVQIHHGKFFVSKEGDFDLLHITLPRADAKISGALANVNLQMDALENLSSLEGEEEVGMIFKVLAVDQDVATLQTIKNLLSSINYHVIMSRTGPEALRKIEGEKPDLVVANIMLPEMNGYELCRSIRQRYSPIQLPIILITAKDQMSDMLDTLPSGANDFITKPLQREEFIARIQTHLQLAKVNDVYSKFVPIELVNILGRDNLVEVQLGDQIQKEMTIMFVDIRAFTSLSENMTPAENFKFINSYLSRLAPMIRKHHGFVDKYIGDAIMALFPQRPEDAVNCAIDLMRQIYIYNGHRQKVGYKPINIGIGVHTGEMILGIIGDEVRMQGTVIADAVNTAARIQDLTKVYGANIIISQKTFSNMENPNEFDLRYLGKVSVKGKETEVTCFEVFDADPKDKRQLKLDTKGLFEESILNFHKFQDGALSIEDRLFHLNEAADTFKEILHINNRDYAAMRFLASTQKLLRTAAKSGMKIG